MHETEISKSDSLLYFGLHNPEAVTCSKLTTETGVKYVQKEKGAKYVQS